MPSEITPSKNVKVSHVVQNFISYASGSFEVIKEGYAAIFITIITSLLAGIFLGKFTDFLISLPGLLILIPGVVDMRGNIFSALGSRLGSEFHLGLIEKFDTKNKVIRDNIYASVTLTFFLSLLLGIFSKILSSLFGLNSIDVYSLILISLLAGIISGAILLVLTFLISFASYSHGWDPDNVTSPLITGMGDLFTIPSLLFAAYIVMPIQKYAIVIVLVSFAVAFLNFALVLKKEHKFRMLILHSSAILILSGLLSCSSGVFMESNIEKLVLFPGILLMIPAFLEEGGNIGGILSSRISTKLHLGLVKPNLRVDETVAREFFNSFVLFVLVFPVVGIFTQILCVITNIPSLGFFKTVIISSVAGFLLTLVIVISTFVMSVIAHRNGIDPDNVLIPIITSIADLLGIYCLLLISGFVIS